MVKISSKVTVVEYLDHIIPGMDREVSKEFQKILSKQGIEFLLDSKVTAVSDLKNKVTIDYINNKSNTKSKMECDKALIAVGRKPYTEGLNLSKIGVKKMTGEE